MKLDQLRRMALFAMVAQEGSFTAVSQQQNIATSAISAAISQLERDIGARLFHRSTRKLTLTDEGAVFLKRCQAMLFEANTAHEELSQMTGQLAGVLTITASQMEAQMYLLPALKSLLQANPKLTLNVLINDSQVDLVAQGIDIALRAGRLDDSSLIARPLAELPEVIVAAPDYIRTYGELKDLAQLAQHRIVAFSAFAQPQHLNLLDAQGKQHSVQLQVGAKTDSVELVRQLTLLGLGVARVPLVLVAADLAAGNLVKVLTDFSLPKIKMYAVTIKRDLQPPKVTAAITALQAYLKSSTESSGL